MNVQPITFDCQGDTLVGLLHKASMASPRCGVVMVVGGGPQYRVGGHRQLTLWARALSSAGYPVLRFDYRGMGDSQGEFRGFMDIGGDLQCAVDALMAAEPGLQQVVLWGECDAAPAILLYAYRDARVAGIAVQNPWVRTESSQAEAVLRHYYLQRLMQPSFWRKLLSGRFQVGDSARSALGLLRQVRSAAPAGLPSAGPDLQAPIPRNLPLPEMMLLGARRFKGRMLCVISGRDLIAKEFDLLLESSPAWRELMGEARVTRFDLADGDHTFSSAGQREQVLQWGLAWLKNF